MFRAPALVPIMIFFLLICATAAEAGQRILALQGVRARPYNEAYEGFRGVLADDADISRIVLSDLSSHNGKDHIREAGPDLILAIGMDALRLAENLKDIPVVYVMALDAAGEFSARDNITGVSMVVEPENQLDIIHRAFPAAKTIGLIYDPEQTGNLVEKIRSAASGQEKSLVTGEVYRPENVPASLMLMLDKIDVFWMLPDLTVVTPEPVRSMLLLAMEAGRPIVSFSEKYAEQGALVSIGVDSYDMGRQAARMAEKIIAGADAASIPAENARKAVVTVNPRIAEKLGIDLDKEALAGSRRIR